LEGFWAFFVGAQFLAHMAFSDNTTDRYKQLNWGFGDQVTTMALLDTGWLPCKQPISIFLSMILVPSGFPWDAWLRLDFKKSLHP